jgi:hypothetical protein
MPIRSVEINVLSISNCRKGSLLSVRKYWFETFVEERGWCTFSVHASRIAPTYDEAVYFIIPHFHRHQRPRKHYESGGALAKRGTFVYDQNQTILCRSRAERNFLKICSFSITSEMVFTESLLVQKGHFLSNKRGRSFNKYFFVLWNRAL